jgi:general secretion pathway protein L
VRDTLYIQLREVAPEEPLAYALASAQPGVGVQVQHATLETIMALAPGRRVVLFVPGADVRLAAVQVPARAPQKILQAAPYALEEQLAEDVDTLHFAIGAPGQADGGFHPVAVVARARMDQWLGPLRARSISADALVPETLCLPEPEGGHWTGLAESGRVTVRTGGWSGFACPLDELATCLQIADPEARSLLRLFVARDVEFDFSRIGRPVELLPGYASGLEILARQWQGRASINLLQGAYSEKEDWQRLARPWRLAGTLAVAWLALAAMHQAAGAWRTGKELAALSHSNFVRCQQVFPKDCVREELMPAVIEQQSRLLHGGSGGRAPLFQLLGSLGAALAANPGLTLESMQFREGALHLSLTGSDLQALEALRGWYGSRRDARLEVEAANAGTTGVQIRLKLTPA